MQCLYTCMCLKWFAPVKKLFLHSVMKCIVPLTHMYPENVSSKTLQDTLPFKSALNRTFFLICQCDLELRTRVLCATRLLIKENTLCRSISKSRNILPINSKSTDEGICYFWKLLTHFLIRKNLVPDRLPTVTHGVINSLLHWVCNYKCFMVVIV